MAWQQQWVTVSWQKACMLNKIIITFLSVQHSKHAWYYMIYASLLIKLLLYTGSVLLLTGVYMQQENSIIITGVFDFISCTKHVTVCTMNIWNNEKWAGLPPLIHVILFTLSAYIYIYICICIHTHMYISHTLTDWLVSILNYINYSEQENQPTWLNIQWNRYTKNKMIKFYYHASNPELVWNWMFTSARLNTQSLF